MLTVKYKNVKIDNTNDYLLKIKKISFLMC